MSDEPDLPEDEGDEPAYEVGYGRPPKSSQFKKGNRHGKGRRRGSRNLKTIVEEVTHETVPAQINGKTKKLPRIELVLRQLAQKASTGDLRAASLLVQLYERYGPVEDDGPILEEETVYDIETLRHCLRMRGVPDDE